MSGEARTCRELGEERTIETALPLRHDQQKLPSRFKSLHPFVAACFEGIDTPSNSMAGRIGIVFQDHLAGLVQREWQAPQPAHETPQQTWRNDRLVIKIFVAFLLARLHAISDQSAIMADCGAIGHASRIALRPWRCGSCWLLFFRHMQILLSQRQQARRSEAFIGQNESRDSR